eukprot:TRINITY_DN111632_c0_g1_i1.p1 TRINITY_DN111632_c0_g1~~TRINITY_DN111632_c0_g1_i1.p1  ORF type:complete len:574 (+),score=93.14 TRINITY_DN111632_c0_g1_i1:88-1809(+)
MAKDEDKHDAVDDDSADSEESHGERRIFRGLREDYDSGGLWGIVGKTSERLALSFFALWIMTGLFMYMARPWGKAGHYYTLGEALYLMTQIITTIGYGDYVPYYPNGYLFTAMYVLCAAVTFSTLISAMTEKLVADQEALFQQELGTVKLVKPLLEGLSPSLKLTGSLDEEAQRPLQAAVQGEQGRHKARRGSGGSLHEGEDGDKSCCTVWTNRVYRSREAEWQAFIRALFMWTLCVIAGMLMYSNYCEMQDCVPGRCCTKAMFNASKAEEIRKCDYLIPRGCQHKFEYKGKNYTGCTLLDSTTGSAWCSMEPVWTEGVSWSRCDSPEDVVQTITEKFHFTWPGKESKEEPLDESMGQCALTTAKCCEAKTYTESFYMSVVTLTTVGFGDMVAVTHGGKWFAIFWMLIGVSAFANLVGKFGAVFLHKSHALEELSTDRLEEMLEDDLIRKCREEHTKMDRTGVSRAEFILYMLQHDVGVVSPEIVNMLSKNFDELDTDKSGYLGQGDLEDVKIEVDQSALEGRRMRVAENQHQWHGPFAAAPQPSRRTPAPPPYYGRVTTTSSRVLVSPANHR